MSAARAMVAAFSMLTASAAGAADAPRGETLLRTVCTQCHGLAMMTKTRDGAGGWRATVDKMITWGAQVRTIEERDELVSFLTSAYGPGSEPSTARVLPPGAPLATSDSAALPPGPGADQVRAYCSMCHDLGPVVSTRRSAAEWTRTTTAMLAKTGAAVSVADARMIARYLDQHLGLPNSPKN